MISERQKRVLEAIIRDFILTAEPVGSRTIARKYMRDLSSATIRNEMSDLEDLGFLEQPHVSAGRIPNAKAYRLYVDQLLQEGAIKPIPEANGKQHLMNRMQQMEDIVYTAAQALSDMTRYTTLVMMPRQESLKISTLQLVPISPATALLVLVTDGGIIRDSVVHVSESLDADALYRISRMMTNYLGGHSLKEVMGLLRGYVNYTDADPRVLLGIAELAEQMEKQSSIDNLTVLSPQNILSFPEYADVKKARAFLAVMEEKDRLMRLMREGVKARLTAFIGPENGIPEMQECSVVLSSYEMSRHHRGAIGIIGPTRMPYQKVLCALATTSASLSRMLGNHHVS